jgi:hypothetical protein
MHRFVCLSRIGLQRDWALMTEPYESNTLLDPRFICPLYFDDVQQDRSDLGVPRSASRRGWVQQLPPRERARSFWTIRARPVLNISCSVSMWWRKS